MTKRQKILLFSITILALILRLVKVNEVPISLNRDEVGLGYDAYSLLKTGRDQFGKFLPLTLRSSDDYKPAIYAYLAIPSIALFGLNAFAVRLPSAILGTLTVLITYFLAHWLFRRLFSPGRFSLLTAFILAISPWHIQFSRGAFEANISLFWVVSGVTFFFIVLSRQRYQLLLGTLFGLAMLTYHAARFVSPVLLVSLIIIYHRYWQRNKKKLAMLLLAFSFLLALALPAMLSPEAQIRLRILSIFADPKFVQQSAENILTDDRLNAPISGRLVHNRRLIPFSFSGLSKLFANFKQHFDPSILIFGIDNPRLQSHHAPNFGVVFFWELLFAVVGLIFLLKKYLSRSTLIIPYWLIIGLLPAAITWDIPSYLRAILVLPTVQILAALGSIEIGEILRRESKWIFSLSSLLFTSWMMFLLTVFLHQYFVHLNYETAENWRYGRKEAALAGEKLKAGYKKVIVSTSLDDPHLFFLFYLRYPPQKYLAAGGTIRGGWTAVENKFDKYEFRPLPSKEQFIKVAEDNILYIGLANEVSPQAKLIKTIYYPNGKEAIKLVTK